MKKVKDIELKGDIKLKSLVDGFGDAGGFTAKKVYDAAKMLERMEGEKDITRILSFPADIVSTGTRGILRKLVQEKKFDLVITTCGTLDHDIARSFSSYYHGEFEMDDVELAKKGIYRLGNVIIPKENYGKVIEEKMQEFLGRLEKREWSTYELIWELGKFINKSNSILYWAYVNRIPVIVPGITDGAVGSQLWSYWEMNRDFKINIFQDEHLLSDIMFTSKKTGALMIGGGISKHHTIWWNQFRGGLDYAIYITTAVEYDGSLSGARTREAISWGKIKPRANHITVEGDATVLLPLIVSYII